MEVKRGQNTGSSQTKGEVAGLQWWRWPAAEPRVFREQQGRNK